MSYTRSTEVAPSLDRLMVEYCATRLRPAEVVLALAGAGISVERAAHLWDARCAARFRT
jgi:hypothetical protein